MDLRTYLDILRRRGWIILLVAVLAGGLAAGISLKQTKIYQATVRISTVPARPDWGLNNSAKDLLRNFVNNINTHDMASAVIANAQLDMNPNDLLSKVVVSAEPDNFIIRIDARDQDQGVAVKIARTMAQLFVDERVAYYNTQDKANRIEVKLVDSVIEPTLWRPQPKANGAAGVALGAIIGALIVLALEWMEADVLATPEAVERHLGLPVLGSAPVAGIPAGKAGSGKVSRAARSAEAASGAAHHLANKGTSMTGNIITLTDPSSAAAEAFRRLRTNLSFARNGTPPQTILVAAAGADGDRAGVVANLAVAFARVGKRVVLADCDLRHPSLHTLFGLSNAAGVTSALGNLAAPLPLQETSVPCLSLLAAGPGVEVPSDALASPQMGELIERLCREADVVLFDAPPVTLATDAAELASQVDGVLLTVSAGHTKRDEARRAKELLERVGAHIVGSALVNTRGKN